MSGFVEQFQAAVESQLSELNTSMPGEVVSWEPDRNRLVVKPVLPKALADGRSLDAPDIVEVPVAWPAAGGAIMTMPIRPGDGLLLLFTARSLEGWLNGDNQAPEDPRKFDLSDAVAIPGLRATGVQADPDAVEIIYDQSKLRFEPGGITRIQSVKTFIDNPVEITGLVTITGNITQTGSHNLSGNVGAGGRIDAVGDVAAGTVSLKTHVHTASGGSGIGGPPVGA